MKHMVFSARLDKALAAKVDAAVRKNRMSKKRFLEEAITDKLLKLDSVDAVLTGSFDSWKRKERPDVLRKQIKSEFSRSMQRHHKA